MFYSILFATPADREAGQGHKFPSCLTDLNLDQIIDTVTATRPEYELKPFFYQPLSNIAAINYRYAVMQDLESSELRQPIEIFSRQFNELQRQLKFTAKLSLYHRAGCFLDIIELYCNSINELSQGLSELPLHAAGLIKFRQYLTEYCRSDKFNALQSGLLKLRTALEQVKYSLHIKGHNIKVSRVVQGQSYNSLLKELLGKFREGTVKSYYLNIASGTGFNKVEIRILELVAKLYPVIFTELEGYYNQYHQDFLEHTIADFNLEIQFYLAYLDYTAELAQHGLPFCYPKLEEKSNNIHCHSSFDLALAHKLLKTDMPIVCNDFHLSGNERIFIVSGPNQGGKTTFARMFGQLHFLASIGCRIPGRDAQLLRINNLFTHFEREERVKTLRGKLQDELIRMEHILTQATANDIIIMNEIFTSTTLTDAKLLSRKIIEKLSCLNVLAVCVTFIDELATLNSHTVGMVSSVIPETPAIRTYKITRQPAARQLYAHTLADKYQLSYEQLKTGIKQ